MHEVIVDSMEENELKQSELIEYLSFIGYKGGVDTSIRTLKELQQLHTEKIPFENLNPFLMLPVDIDLQSIKTKFLYNCRGGYCFEHNTLFTHVLKLIGFKVKCLLARVLWNVSGNVVPPRGHMLILVDVEGEPYIADAGFGGLSLTGPIKFILDVEQQTPHEPFRIVTSGEEFLIQAKIKDQRRNLYQFGLMEQLPQDYEVANYGISSNPNSHFTYTLIATRSVPGNDLT